MHQTIPYVALLQVSSYAAPADAAAIYISILVTKSQWANSSRLCAHAEPHTRFAPLQANLRHIALHLAASVRVTNHLAVFDSCTALTCLAQLSEYQLHADHSPHNHANSRAMHAGQGYVVIGSDDGQIRMYSEKSLTRANTAIPGLGGPITAVDVTYDGKWVLATTKNYLMVVKTTYKVCTDTI